MNFLALALLLSGTTIAGLSLAWFHDHIERFQRQTEHGSTLYPTSRLNIILLKVSTIIGMMLLAGAGLLLLGWEIFSLRGALIYLVGTPWLTMMLLAWIERSSHRRVIQEKPTLPVETHSTIGRRRRV